MIDSNEKLAHILPRLEQAHWISLDTEADSLHAYPEKLCLLQISVAGHDYLVDPLAGVDVSPLWEIFRNHELIFHAADYDLRLLHRTFGFVPTRVFDTMLAARLLNYPELGLNSLVQKLLGITLEKSSQKADWARRPLTAKMEAYARNDTHYLHQIAVRLRKELKEKGRLAWHQETCERLIADCSQEPESDRERWRIRGSHKLGRLGLAMLRELWHWREHEAVAANKPPYFVLSHEALVAIAAAAEHGKPLEPLLPHFLSTRRREALERAIAQGFAIESHDRPVLHRVVTPRPTEAEKRRFEELKVRRDKRAQDLDLDPALIASRATLALLAQDWDLHQPELMNWQRDLLQ